jgi:tetratricopeptide (TPR) repeat protein
MGHGVQISRIEYPAATTLHPQTTAARVVEPGRDAAPKLRAGARARANNKRGARGAAREQDKATLARNPAPARGANEDSIRTAFAAYLRGELDEAHRLYRRAVAQFPMAAEAWRGLGLVAARLGRYGEARRALGHYLSLAPEALDVEAIAERKRSLP